MMLVKRRESLLQGQNDNTLALKFLNNLLKNDRMWRYNKRSLPGDVIVVYVYCVVYYSIFTILTQMTEFQQRRCHPKYRLPCRRCTLRIPHFRRCSWRRTFYHTTVCRNKTLTTQCTKYVSYIFALFIFG